MGIVEGKVAIVTGAGRGVGRAEALLLAKEGAMVVVNDLGGTADGMGNNAMVADEVVKEIKDSGGQAAPNYSDISDLEGVDNMIWTALSKFGRLDIMINNAGILRDKTLLNMTETDWDLIMKVHAKGTFLGTRAAARVMRTQKTGGAILNTTSISGLAGNFGQANYGCAKAGIYSFTKIAAMEFARYGIRVNCVGPSGFTRLVATIPGAGDRGDEISSVEPSARLAVFLCSDMAKDLNGRVMSSHGGTLGNKIIEFKMSVSEGWQKDGGMASFDEIKENLDKILIKEPDLNMGSGAFIPKA
ncbi:MAG: SDR family NAD(P)-dependent oxidoreductase [Proteobacteria bacterium]|nr:SDR family NAD(P)-dependent oxidoreductase [Pseudomonadota bacterium]MBU4470608.1 SDR family NAD(P)-dependent oxidoreductase [Pseudomonadota bacterium]MCG2753333.1 SDR family oxidoreductase [Desulfobacteraceae bacterium]